jgi:DNA-binding LacI/PurR family transcriptional regulator
MAGVNRRVTIKDVAKRSGVTHATVSRVIHKDPRISAPTAQRVFKAIQALNYRPNPAARGLVNRHAQVIALIVPDLNPHVLPIIRGVASGATKWDYALMLMPMDTWLEEDRSVAFVAQNWLVDGILLYNLIWHEKVPPKVQQLMSSNVPLVFINKFLDKKKQYAVGVDNFQSVHLAVEHLAKLGHKRIGYLKGGMTSVDGVERYLAFQEAMQKLGLVIDERYVGVANFNDDQAYHEMKRILLQRTPPTAVYCANDLMCIGAIRAIKEQGLSVPDDIAVAGFDDLEAGRYVETPLTTIRPPTEYVGFRAFELLMDMLQKPNQEPRQIKLPSELIVRASTVKPMR